MQQNSGNGWITGLLVGMAIGAGLGLMYAPKTGAETRDMLMKRANELKERAMTFGNSYRQKDMANSTGGDGSRGMKL